MPLTPYQASVSPPINDPEEEAYQARMKELEEAKKYGPPLKYENPGDIDPWAWSGMSSEAQREELVNRRLQSPEFQQRVSQTPPEVLQKMGQQTKLLGM